LLTAALVYLGTGLHPIWWLLWFVPIPVIAIAPRLHAVTAFLLSAVAWLIGEMNQWNYVWHVIQLPPGIAALYFIVPGVVFGFGVLFVRCFLRRRSVYLAAIAFPVYWVTYEYVSVRASLHGTWGNLAYTQMDCLPAIQIASTTGIWGITFIAFLFAGAVAALMSGVGTRRQRGVVAISAGLAVCTALLFGTWRVRATPSGQSVAVTLMARDVPMSVYLGSEDEALRLLGEYAAQIPSVVPSGTQVVVLPEKIGRITENALAAVDSLYSSIASSTGAAIILGVVRKTSSGDFNSSRLYSADGKFEANYDKHHLIPGVEPERPGDKRVVLDEPSGRWGLQICKDMDFPKLSRQYAAEGANLLLVPAWDFNVDAWLHSRMAVLRAVENGFALARSARNGLLTLSDNRGRILAETATAPGRFVSINGQVNISPDRTFYARTGDWFAWVCVALFVSMVAFQLLTLSKAGEKKRT
jgi:apolipoprotein N-acyltransferase